MKKIQTLWLILTVVLFAAGARAESFTIKVDHPERITFIGNNLTTLPPSVSETNVIQYTPSRYASMQIAPGNGYYVSDVSDSKGNTLGKAYNGNFEIYNLADYDGEVFTVSTGDISEDRKNGSSVYVTVDNPDGVKVNLKGMSGPLSLRKGENEVKFIPSLDLPLTVESAKSGVILASVTRNGTAVDKNYMGVYEFRDLKDSDRIDIKADFPAENYTVDITLPEGVDPTDAISGIRANRGSESYDVAVSSSLSVMAGYVVTIDISPDYNFKSYTLDGVFKDAAGSLSIKDIEMTGNHTLAIDAAPYKVINAVITISDPEHIVLSNQNSSTYSWKVIEGLKAGENIVKVSEASPKMKLEARTGAYVKSVVDESGNAAAFDSYSKAYQFTVSEEHSEWTVVSQAYSTDPVKVMFSLPSDADFNADECVNAVAEVTSDNGYEPVETSGDGFMALPGHTYKIYKNDLDFYFRSITYEDGSNPDDVVTLPYSAEFTVVEGGVLTLNAEPGTNRLHLSVSVNEPDHIRLYQRYNSWDMLNSIEVRNLNAGANNLWITPSWNGLTVLVDEGYFATVENRTTGKTTVCKYSANSGQTISVGDGDELEINVERIIRDCKALVHVNGLENASSVKVISAQNETPWNLTEGDNVIEFNANYDSPLTIEIKGGVLNDNNVFAYKDGERLKGQYSTSTYAGIPAEHGSVIRLYIDREEEPATCDVSFDVEGDRSFTVYRDIINEVADLSAPAAVYPGTRFDIVPDDNANITVSVNGTPLKQENKMYSFAVSKNTAVKISNIPTGVAEIHNDSVPGNTDVYSVDGVLILKNPTASDIRSLPSGLYICNGRKIVVK